MKKFLSVLVLINLLAVLIVPMAVSAQVEIPKGCTMTHDVGVEGCQSSGFCDYDANPKCGVCCLLNTIYTVTDWIFIFLIAISVIMVLFGAYTFMTAAGDPEKVSAARSYLIYALIGLVVAFLARALPAIVRMVIG